MTTASYRVRTRLIGDEIVRLVREGAATLGLKLCQYGGVPRNVPQKPLEQILPFVILTPQETSFAPLGMAGLQYTVTETYRLAYGFQYVNTEHPMDRAADELDIVLGALRTDATLRNATALMRETYADKIEVSELTGIEWNPDEDNIANDEGAAVKVVVARWSVQWRTGV